MSTQQYGGYSGANTSEAQQQVDINARTVHYKCGDCDQDVPLKRGEPIRCRQCGHRVLYKQRTNRRQREGSRGNGQEEGSSSVCVRVKKRCMKSVAYRWGKTREWTSADGCVAWYNSRRDERGKSLSNVRTSEQDVEVEAKSRLKEWRDAVHKR
ncbi:DNA binding [Ascochyta rabiei]|uniref:DNA binding n=2 Tax=Didymellaceae TaxID=683158 RepID=A0A163CZ62_DIDRA|nr:DNA binding [Ascochyta rabiei]